MTFTLIVPMAMTDRGKGARDPDARMEMMDVNDAMTRSEMARREQAKAARLGAERFARLDADGDGEIPRAEVSGDRIARMFDRLDANDDDILSAGELDAAKAMRGKRGGKGSGRH